MIESVDFIKIYDGDGVNDTFLFNYPFIEKDELMVLEINQLTNAVTVRVYGTHYEVTASREKDIYVTGDVVYEEEYIPSSDVKVYIIRATDLTQLIQYIENDNFPSASHEAALDKMILITQEIMDAIRRLPLLDVYSTLRDITADDPVDGRTWYYDAANKRWKNTDINLNTVVPTITALVDTAVNSAASASSSASTALTQAGIATGAAAAASASAISADNSAQSAAASEDDAELHAEDAENLVALGLAGFTFIPSCSAASTGNYSGTYNNGAAGVGATLTNNSTQTAFEIDGYFPAAGERVILKDQSNEIQNGIYVVTNEGSVSTNWVLTRATDFDEAIALGTFTNITNGFVNLRTLWLYVGEENPTWGTDDILFDQIVFSGLGQGTVLSVEAGVGLAGGTITETGTIDFDPGSLTPVTPTNLDSIVLVDESDSDNPKIATIASLFALTPQEPIGIPKLYFGTVAPTGYVLCDGKTIGNASSNATSRANADTQDLFTHLWNLPDAVAQLYNSSGTPISRGANAATDFAANHNIVVPDSRGFFIYILDNLGGTAANRITSASADGANAQNIGGRVGGQTATISAGNLPTLSVTIPTAGGYTSSGSNITRSGNGISQNKVFNITGTGANTPLTNTPPGLGLGLILRL